MSDDAKPKSRFDFDLPEIKPIQAFGRVWKVWELNVIWFFAFFISYLLLGIFWVTGFHF